MRILCPTCGGKGSIPDPKLIGVPMCYVGPNGEGCPHVFCQSCGGSGWVNKECHCQEKQSAPPAAPSGWGMVPGNTFIPPGQSSITIFQSSSLTCVG